MVLHDGKDYKRGSHTVWDCKYHIAWTAKFRREIARSNGDDLCGIYQSESCAHVDRDAAGFVGGALPRNRKPASLAGGEFFFGSESLRFARDMMLL